MLAFGCSITAGEELEGQPTVASLFADYINEPLTNFASGGASNEEILFTAHEKITAGQTVLVGISDISRVYWPHSKTIEMSSQQMDKEPKNPLPGMKNSLDTWLKFCYNEYTLEQYYIKRFKHLEKYVQTLGNKIYFFSGISPPDSLFKKQHGNNWFTKISLVNFCDEHSLGRMPKGHPTSEAHKQYFEEMIKEFNI